MKLHEVTVNDKQGAKLICRIGDEIYQFTLKNKQFSPSGKMVNFDGYYLDYHLGWIFCKDVEVLEVIEVFECQPYTDNRVFVSNFVACFIIGVFILAIALAVFL